MSPRGIMDAVNLIGNTPLIKLDNIRKEFSIKANIYAKYEAVSLTGSVKDRAVFSMLEEGIANNTIKSNSTIVEASSGNTGIALAALSGLMGLKSIIVMPDSMSVERIHLMENYGARVILSEGRKGMQGAVDRANELVKENSTYVLLDQFNNKANSLAHYKTTGPEILSDLKEIDAFVAGIGTGGTITGVGTYIREKKPQVSIVGVEPKNSPFLSKGRTASHGIQGIGAGFLPGVLDKNIYDSVVTVGDEDAIDMARLLAKKEGLFVGISSGAALDAALNLALKPDSSFKNIVVLLPDSGDRYLSVF